MICWLISTPTTRPAPRLTALATSIPPPAPMISTERGLGYTTYGSEAGM